MLARRILMLAAVLMLLTALAAGIAPREPATDGVPPGATPSGLPSGTTVVEQIPAEAGANSQVVVQRGDILELEVRGNTLDSVLIERLELMDAVEPDTPARFHLVMDAPAGAYPIRLVEADRRIGSIEIRE